MTTALVVIDMQVSLIEDETPDPDRIMSIVFDLVARAREAGVPVVWVTDENVTPDPTLHPAFRIKPGEAHVIKRQGNAFADTALAGELGGRGVDRLVICGMQSDHCIAQTVRAAPAYGFMVTLVEDAHTTHDFDGRGFRSVIETVNRELAVLEDVIVVASERIAFD
ncbi:isochorismatase family protein [Maritimibacter dapengensis]|uniref:Isochorismatase family protein n=1 Tax=Maritimibacter dapengensis TaxID=2836868 RepID=A0ABS6SXV9_9RHOB|nr:isochorismatase family protein [Maritimibacter dapengensis]MBV7377796.1 isochorismatase family protein [Maritimibacter dapengensis]